MHRHIYDENDLCFECDMPKDKTAHERVARYEARKKDAGLVRVHVWVPADQREKLLAYAGKLRDV